MDCFVGLDISLRSVAICVIDVDGRSVFERSVACEIDDISRSLARFVTVEKVTKCKSRGWCKVIEPELSKRSFRPGLARDLEVFRQRSRGYELVFDESG